MPRLPFNTDPPSPPDPSRGTGQRTPARDAMTVAQVSMLVKQTLSEFLPARLRVVGEVSNLSDRTHWFFSLKDAAASIRCVCFASAARRVGFRMRDGMEVVISGRVDYYEAQGSLQLYVETIEPVGQGALELEFRALCEELRRLGYFEIERKKPLPIVPRAVAVVTSRQAAALQDVINTASRRWPGCRLLLYDVRVQGEQAAPQIAASLRSLSVHGGRLGVDAIILTRGGGSIEDLWAFNERIVADAVYECSLPIVAAIGHETDTTIAELVADQRCATPTQAAMHVVPERATLDHQLHQSQARLSLMLRRALEHGQHRLAAVQRHPVFHQPARMLQWQQRRLEDLARRLHSDMPRRLTRDQDRLNALARHLDVVGPRSVLQRGYSYTVDVNGNVLRKPADVSAGDHITTFLAEGKLTSEVLAEGGETKPFRKAPARPSRPSKSKAGNQNQKGLFD